MKSLHVTDKTYQITTFFLTTSITMLFSNKSWAPGILFTSSEYVIIKCFWRWCVCWHFENPVLQCAYTAIFCHHETQPFIIWEERSKRPWSTPDSCNTWRWFAYISSPANRSSWNLFSVKIDVKSARYFKTKYLISGSILSSSSGGGGFSLLARIWENVQPFIPSPPPPACTLFFFGGGERRFAHVH